MTEIEKAIQDEIKKIPPEKMESFLDMIKQFKMEGEQGLDTIEKMREWKKKLRRCLKKPIDLTGYKPMTRDEIYKDL